MLGRFGELTPKADFEHSLPISMQGGLVGGLALLDELGYGGSERVDALGTASEGFNLLRSEAVEAGPVRG